MHVSAKKYCRDDAADFFRGITVVELLVAVAIVAVLISLILPAVQQSREAARRIFCTNNIKQIVLGCENYTASHGCYPAGQVSGFVSILQDIGQAKLFGRFNSPSITWYSVPLEIITARPPLLGCPSDGQATSNPLVTSYNWNRGWDLPPAIPGYAGIPTGVLLPPGRSILMASDTSDGLSNTVLLAESVPIAATNGGISVWRDGSSYEALPPATLNQRCRDSTQVDPHAVRSVPWTSPIYGHTTFAHVLPPNSKTCTFVHTAASTHTASGTNVGLCDGSARFISSSIDITVWQVIGTRNGGEFVYE